jgi:hypothetical protein
MEPLLSSGSFCIRLRHEAVALELALDGLLLEGEALQLEPDRADLRGDGAGVVGAEIVGRHVGERELERFQLAHEPRRQGACRHGEKGVPGEPTN